MHVLTVLSHPNPASFSHAVAQQFVAGAKAAGHTTELADLHAEGFNPVWQAGDFAQDKGDPMPSDVLAEQARIERSDALCMIFPLWWWGMPSMMKGWVDRVFSWGWAYDQVDDPSPERSLLRPRPCTLLVPAGASPKNMIDHGYIKALEAIWLTGTLGYCGIKEPELTVLYGSTGKPERRVAHLETAFQAGRAIGVGLAASTDTVADVPNAL